METEIDKILIDLAGAIHREFYPKLDKRKMGYIPRNERDYRAVVSALETFGFLYELIRLKQKEREIYVD